MQKCGGYLSAVLAGLAGFSFPKLLYFVYVASTGISGVYQKPHLVVIARAHPEAIQ
jgi:hypothetical protein